MDTSEIRVANLPDTKAAAAPPEAPAKDDDLSFLDGQTESQTAPEPTPEPVPEPKPEPQPQAIKPKHSRIAVKKALELGASQGITLDQIHATDPDFLDDWIEQQEHLLASQPKKPLEVKDDDLTIDEEELVALSPGMRKLLKSVPDLHKSNKQLQNELKARKEQDEARQRAQTMEMIDAAMDRLPDEYRPVVGEGGLADQAKDSDEADARISIFLKAKVDFANDTPRAIDKKVRAAAEKLYGRFVKKPEKKAETEEPGGKRKGFTQDEFDRGVLARPTQSKPKPTKGEQAAREAIRDMANELRERGVLANGNGDQFDGVPE